MKKKKRKREEEERGGSSVGGGAPSTSEQEFVREKISEATGVHFEVVAPHAAFPMPAAGLEWFMRCRDQEGITKAPYLNTVWKETGVGIWLESLAIGDTIDWIELAYGDERATQSLDFDYSRLEEPEFKAEFERRYPIVMNRMTEYDEAVGTISKRRGTKLEIRRAGSKGMLVFTVASLIKVRKGATPRSLGSAIEESIAALKEAYERITKV